MIPAYPCTRPGQVADPDVDWLELAESPLASVLARPIFCSACSSDLIPAVPHVAKEGRREKGEGRVDAVIAMAGPAIPTTIGCTRMRLGMIGGVSKHGCGGMPRHIIIIETAV